MAEPNPEREDVPGRPPILFYLAVAFLAVMIVALSAMLLSLNKKKNAPEATPSPAPTTEAAPAEAFPSEALPESDTIPDLPSDMSGGIPPALDGSTPAPTPEPTPRPTPKPTPVPVDAPDWVNEAAMTDLAAVPANESWYAAPRAGISINDAAVRLRGGPGTGYPAVRMLPAGSPLEISAEENGWAFVCYRGVYGWVDADYVKDAPEAEAEPETGAEPPEATGIPAAPVPDSPSDLV